MAPLVITLFGIVASHSDAGGGGRGGSAEIIGECIVP